MPATSRKQEVEQLVVEQIRVFTQPEKMNDMEMFEYHLRHHRILELYREMDMEEAYKGAGFRGWPKRVRIA